MDLPDNVTAIDAADLVALTVDVVSAYVSHNALNSTDLPKLIGDIHSAL